MPKNHIVVIPPGLPFSALQLTRDPATGDVEFDLAVIEQIERASGLPVGFFAEGGEDRLGDLLTRWYRSHLAAGGAPDPVYADLIGEAEAEDRLGGGVSHQPGRA